MATLTAANAAITLSIPGLFPTPVQIQGFEVDDVYDMDGTETAETKRGVDGKLSYGWVYGDLKQNFTIQADSSATINFVEAWYLAERTAQEKYPCSGVVTLPGISRVFTQTNGVMSNWMVMPTVKKLIQARRFLITWDTITGAPI